VLGAIVMESFGMVGKFPDVRMRRMRQYAWSRDLVAEHQLTVNDLIWPVFVVDGKGQRQDVPSMPGVQRYSIDILVDEVRKAASLGIPAIALFPVVDNSKKTEDGSEATNQDSLICKAISEIKNKVPEIGVIADVALDPYTTHGQDGIVENDQVMNDKTVEVLCRQAVVLAEAGCDIIAPSDMMDGRVGALRKALDKQGYTMVSILSYAAKYASAFYGPFREAVGSASNLGGKGKNSYQMDVRNGDEAMREVALDVAEGADMVMVKPGMPHLDIICRVKAQFNVPVLAYQVSGEYAMIKAASDRGWLMQEPVIYESLIAFKRAGATAILTYAAREMASWLKDH